MRCVGFRGITTNSQIDALSCIYLSSHVTVL